MYSRVLNGNNECAIISVVTYTQNELIVFIYSDTPFYCRTRFCLHYVNCIQQHLFVKEIKSCYNSQVGLNSSLSYSIDNLQYSCGIDANINQWGP